MIETTTQMPDALEVRTAMKDGIRKETGMFRFAHLALVAVFTLLLGLAGMAGQAQAYSAGDPIYINMTASNYCAGQGNNFDITVTLTDFDGNPVTGASSGLTLKKVEDNAGGVITHTFNENAGGFTDNGDGTYTQTGNINDSGGDPYYMEVEWRSGDYKMKSGLTLNIGTTCSNSIPTLFDSAGDYVYYPTSGTVVAKVRLVAQDGSPYTGATLETGNAGTGGVNTIYVNKVESINKANLTWTVSSATDNGDGTYDFVIDYSGGSNDLWPVEFRYDYDAAGNVRLSTSFVFEINTTQAPSAPTGTPPTNPGATELTCSDTNGSSVTLTDPTQDATVSGSITLATSLTNATNAEYSIDGGAWTPIGTLWNTQNTHPGSTSAPVTGVTVDVRAVEDECGGYVTDSITVTVDNTCTEATQSSIIWNGTTTAAGDFNGSTFVTLTDVNTMEYQVTEGSGPGAPFEELEYFDTADDVCDYSNWTASNFPSGNCGGTLDAGTNGGPLYVFNSAQSPNGDGTLTGSGGTGPTSLHSGTSPPGGFIWREESGGPYPDETFTRNASFDADTYEPNVSFAASQWGADSGSLIFEVNDGGGWVTEWEVVGDDGNAGAWTFVDINLFAGTVSIDGGGSVSTTTYGGTGTAYTSGTLDFRFRWSGATNWEGDAALDTIRVYGPAKASETTVIPWTSDPVLASGVLTDGNTYNLYARGLDPECGVAYYGDSVAQTVSPGTSQTFTWSACTETGTVSIDALPGTVAGPTAITASVGGGAAGAEVRWNEDGGAWSAWQPSGATYTPTNCQAGTLNVEARATGTCGTISATPASTSYDTTDTDLATLTSGTDPASPVSFTTTVYATVGTESIPNSMTNMQVDIAGTAGGTCDVTGGAMTWSAANSRWEYSWDTSACGTSAVETGITIDVSGTDPDCSDVVNAGQLTVDIDNTCTETGTVDVSISPDPGAGDLTGPVTVDAVLGGGASNGLVRWRVDGGPWSLWATSGATFTPPNKSFGTVEFEAMADGSCGAVSPVYSTTISRSYETRIDALEPKSLQEAVQSGLTAIQARFDYCNDKNNTGTFLVEYKLASSGTWLTAAGTPTADGGAGDTDGALNEEVIVLIGGLTTGELYDVRITYIDATDGVIGTAVYDKQVELIAWTDQPMLHNALRFACDKPGYSDQASCEAAGGVWTLDRKWTGGWGTDVGEYGPILCSTCHAKGSSNIKRVVPSAIAGSGSFPGSTVTFTDATDGSADFGDDAGGHASSDKVCEVCHTVTQFHRYDTTTDPDGGGPLSAQSDLTHYNQADCTKCHKHDLGFRASCSACHGNPPTASTELTGTLNPVNDTGSTTEGEHDFHANTLGYECNTCHNGWEASGQMPNNGQINLGFVTPGTNGGTYDGRSTGAGYITTDGLTTIFNGDGMTCAVYCHGYGTPTWDPAATADCGACHGEVGSYGDNRAGAPTGGTSLDLSGAGSGSKVGKHANHLDDSLSATGDPCALCHDGFGYADATHLDGSVDVTLNGAAGASANFSPGTPGTCTNLACHGDADWDSAVSGSCDFCHGYPPNSTNNSHAAGVTPVDHDSLNITPNHDQCAYCHGYKDNGTGALAYADVASLQGSWTATDATHMDGQVTMNGDGNATAGDDAGYDAATGGCDAAACHANDATHQVGGGNTGSTIGLVDIGPGSCGTCHDTGVGGAPVVTGASTHVTVTRGGTYGDCTDCHTGHTSASGGVNIPNNATVGISYTAAGHSGIKLGGSGTHASISGLTTEAEICWGCHDADGSVSEWGANNQTNTGSMSYDYGSLSQSNWVGATWTSGVAKFGYKTGGIQSTHSVNPAATGPGMDAVGDIRCSYCHDVHDLNQATGDSLAGAPYLRGNWMGNPYPEDGAPQAGDTWTTNNFGAVPRGTAASNELGGFQIDQNNGNPTNGWTLNSSAGLCTLCHGSDVDNMNQFGTASTDWVGTNGHSNAVIGGTGSNAANIFSINDRNSSPPTFINDDSDVNSSGGNPAMAYQQVSVSSDGQNDYTGNRGFGFRSSTSEPDGWNLNPRTGTDRIHDSYDWGADTANNLDTAYHNFSCSKCHNPHASRLPRLMITNCLDTRHNTWDDQASVDSIPAAGTQNQDRSSTVSTDNGNVTFSQATSAQNCHRVADPAYNNARGAGWNNVTPW